MLHSNIQKSPNENIILFYKTLLDFDTFIKEKKDLTSLVRSIIKKNGSKQLNSSDIWASTVFEHLDLKYVPLEATDIDHKDWRLRKFAIGILLIEFMLGKEIENIDDLMFKDDDTIALNTQNPEFEIELNAIIRSLLDYSDNGIPDVPALKIILQPLVFQCIGLKRLNGLWISDLIKKKAYDAFLSAKPHWQKGAAINKELDGKYLRYYDQLDENEPARGVNGAAARAYCDWLSEELDIEPFYGHSKNGFRLLPYQNHQQLLQNEQLSHKSNQYNEITDDGDNVRIFESNEYQEISRLISTSNSVFRMCIKERRP